MEELQNLTPLYNKEFYLAYLCGEDVELPIPDGNTEHYLAYLCGMDVPIPYPLYTKEFYLAYKCGMDVELPEPGPYRIDQYLAKWCGMDVEVPEPMYRIEYWLAQLANSGELKTVSGNPISVSDALARPAESLVIEILPQQDLHGYANPWPAGGGKNKLHLLTTETTTTNGVTFTVNADGTVSTQGTANGTAVFRHYMTSADLPSGESVILNGCPSGGGFSNIYGIALCNSQGSVIGGKSDIGDGTTYTAEDLSSLAQLQIVVRNGQNVTGKVFKPMIRLASVADDTFAPYENLCPITGFTGVNIYHESAYDPDADPTYAIDWQDEAGTVYGGSLDVTSGVLTVDRAIWTLDSTVPAGTAGLRNISTVAGFTQVEYYPYRASGKTGGAIVSDKFAYASSVSDAYQVLTDTGNTRLYFTFPAETNTDAAIRTWFTNNPTQVVYELATPQTIQLTPTQVQMLLGNNVLWNDVDGDMTLEYLADGPADDADALQILLGNRYVNNGEADEATDREALEILLGGSTR